MKRMRVPRLATRSFSGASWQTFSRHKNLVFPFSRQPRHAQCRLPIPAEATCLPFPSVSTDPPLFSSISLLNPTFLITSLRGPPPYREICMLMLPSKGLKPNLPATDPIPLPENFFFLRSDTFIHQIFLAVRISVTGEGSAPFWTWPLVQIQCVNGIRHSRPSASPSLRETDFFFKNPLSVS